MPRKKGKVEFRYYEVPHGEPLLALLGDAWIRPYGYDEHDRPITDLHFHNLLEIGYCYEGRGELIFEDTVYPYEAGVITVIPKNYPHTTNGVREITNRWEYLFVDAEKMVQQLFDGQRGQSDLILARLGRQAICTTQSRQPEMASLIRSVLGEMTHHRAMYAEAVNGLMKTLFIEISRYAADHAENGEENLFRQKKAEQVQIARALEYVGDYYARPLRVGDMAGACHMSETHFRRLFVKCMGMHPVDYINQVRVKMACDRLRKTNEPIADVAVKCGFPSLATFNRNFRRITGAAPNEWKKQPEAYEWRLQEKVIEMHEGW